MKTTKKIILFAVLLMILIGILFFVIINKDTLLPSDNSSNPQDQFPSFPNNTPSGATSSDEVISENIPPLDEQQFLRYFSITNESVRGYVTTGESSEFGEIIIFQDAKTGHLFERSLSPITESVKMSNTTIPKISKSLITPDNSKILLQYLEPSLTHFETFLGTIEQRSTNEISQSALSEDQTPYKIVGEFLPQNIEEITFSPDFSDIFYLRVFDDGSEGILMNSDGSSSQVAFTSPLTEWLVNWDNPSHIVLTTKPSGATKGFSYTLNSSTGSLIGLVGDINGLTVLPHPLQQHVLYSESIPTRGDILMRIFNKETQVTTPSLSIKTIPEKCVWSRNTPIYLYCAVPKDLPRALYPDAWYRGEVSFSDEFIRVNIETGQTNTILDPESFDEPAVDAIDLKLSGNDEYLLFINKKDSSLWAIRLQ